MPKIKGPDRMPRPTKRNLSQFRADLESVGDPRAIQLADEMGDKNLFEMMHSMRRWYSGQTMAHKLKQHHPTMQRFMDLRPDAAVGIYRGFKVPNDHQLARVQPGEQLELEVPRNRGLSSWSTNEEATNRFSGGGRGRTGLIVRLTDPTGIRPLIAPPEKTEGWFNELYEKTIGTSYRPSEGEYLIEAPKVGVEVVRVKKR